MSAVGVVFVVCVMVLFALAVTLLVASVAILYRRHKEQQRLLDQLHGTRVQR